MVKFVMFTKKMLDWDEVYSFQKFLCLLTRWQLKNYDVIRNKPDSLKGILVPDFIRKRRTLKNIVCYEIVWKDPENHFVDLIPTYQINEIEKNPDDNILKTLWTTIEPKTLVDVAYPDLVESFEETKRPKKDKQRCKKPTSKKQKNKPLRTVEANALNASFNGLSISPKRNTNKVRKRRLEVQKDVCKNVKKLNDFFPPICSNVQMPVSKSAENKQGDCSMISLNESSFENEQDLDLSSIVENIVNQKLNRSEDLIGLEFDCDCDNSDYVETETENEENEYGNCNRVSFFFGQTNDEDAFEKILNNTLHIPDNDNNDETAERLSDEFDILLNKKYIPLIERIKRKL